MGYLIYIHELSTESVAYVDKMHPTVLDGYVSIYLV